jgi:hypothetical protein
MAGNQPKKQSTTLSQKCLSKSLRLMNTDTGGKININTTAKIKAKPLSSLLA